MTKFRKQPKIKRQPVFKIHLTAPPTPRSVSSEHGGRGTSSRSSSTEAAGGGGLPTQSDRPATPACGGVRVLTIRSQGQGRARHGAGGPKRKEAPSWLLASASAGEEGCFWKPPQRPTTVDGPRLSTTLLLAHCSAVFWGNRGKPREPGKQCCLLYIIIIATGYWVSTIYQELCQEGFSFVMLLPGILHESCYLRQIILRKERGILWARVKEMNLSGTNVTLCFASMALKRQF